MQNTAVLFSCDGEVVRYLRDMLVMVWDDLPVRMVGDALFIEFKGRSGVDVSLSVYTEEDQPVTLPAPRRGLVLRIGQDQRWYGHDIHRMLKCMIGVIRQEYILHYRKIVLDSQEV